MWSTLNVQSSISVLSIIITKLWRNKTALYQISYFVTRLFQNKSAYYLLLKPIGLHIGA